MLPKEERLNLKKDFKWVSSGKRAQTGNFKVFYRFGDLQTPRVGIALAKQQFRKAHDRNRARRLSSTVVQRLYPRLRKGLNLVIMPKVDILKTHQEVLSQELENVKDLFDSH